jgi:type IV pilus assembly protein PilW
MFFLSSELRMAGFDPTNMGNVGFTTALPGQISFTQDLNSDGDLEDAGEQIDFGFQNAIDNNRDGFPDGGNAAPLGRQVGGAGGYQAIADNIQAIEFIFLDSAGVITPNVSDIVSVQVSILARAGDADPDFFNSDTYLPGSNTTLGTVWGPYLDNFRRRLLVSIIQCRNIGL